MRAWRSLDRFRADAAFSTWLYRIATNTALKRMARRRDVPVAEPTDRAVAEHDPAQRVEQQERLEVAMRALGTLTPEQRACWVLRELEGLSYEELADVLGLTIAAVKGRLFRARSDVAEALSRYDRSGGAT